MTSKPPVRSAYRDPGLRRDSESRIESHDWLNVMVHRESTNEAEWLAALTQCAHGNREVVVAAGDAGEELGFRHRGGELLEPGHTLEPEALEAPTVCHDG